MKKIILLVALIVVLTSGIALIITFSLSGMKPQLVNLNGQLGFVASSKAKDVTIDDEVVELYDTYSKKVTLHYSSMNLDEGYANQIIINQKAFPLIAANDSQNVFVDHKISFLGANIVDGSLSVTIKTGMNGYGHYDTFSLRNITLEVDGDTYWSVEYSEANYSNTDLRFGYNLETDYRFGYQESRTLTFKVDEKHLNAKGTLLESKAEVVSVKIKNKVYDLPNQMFMSIDMNINEGQTISSNHKLVIEVDGPSKILWNAFLDGYPIRPDFSFDINAWAVGSHTLKVVAVNEYGRAIEKSVEFTLSNVSSDTSNLDYIAYEPGIDEIDASKLPKEFGKVIDLNNYQTPFSKLGVMYLEITPTDDTTVIWEGSTGVGRTLIMQAYNTVEQRFDIVSVSPYQDGLRTLGFDYKAYGNDYVHENKVIVRIYSNNDAAMNITKQIFHITDTQYMTQYGSIGGVYGEDAIAAFDAMTAYIEGQFINDNLVYLMTTGDYVQTMRNQEAEWPVINTHFFNPLFALNIPFGVVSGNHDIGGTSDNPLEGSNGSNSLDEYLIYEHFGKHLGLDKFETKPWHGGSSDVNNRSSYQVMNIDGHEFLFLYLGWGSSSYGTNVSSIDVEYGKSILEANPDKTVVLLVHNYMSGKGVRGLTGNYLYNQLVSQYKNIKFVFSGHVRGTFGKVDSFDDDGDGIKDRQVLQVVTNFQEEEELFGASWIRKIGLDFANNKMHFTIYSPFVNDYDITVGYYAEVVKDNREFAYAFDLSLDGYAMVTESVE